MGRTVIALDCPSGRVVKTVTNDTRAEYSVTYWPGLDITLGPLCCGLGSHNVWYEEEAVKTHEPW